MIMGDVSDLSRLVILAQAGNKSALEDVVSAVQDRVHHLAIRMVVNPEDAKDATQEILILIITKLSTFRGESAFTTWVYRVACRYLLTARNIAARDPGLSFDAFGADLRDGLLIDPAPPADDVVMLNELRISCTMAMLLCLKPPHRAAYILGDILELDHNEAADVLDQTPASYRQQLSRARREVVAFTSRSCGLVNADAPCSCPRRLPAAVAQGRVQPGQLSSLPKDAPSFGDALRMTKNVVAELSTLKLQRATGQCSAPHDLSTEISRIVETRAEAPT
jgi:RNA polymerase sigma factor (sigma-70 family)